MFDQDDESPTGGYWPSVTDLFMTLFIISIVILGAVFYVLLPKNNIAAEKAVIVAAGKDMVDVIDPINRLRAELDLPLIKYRTAKQVVHDLNDTCDKAVERIRSNEEEIEKLKKLFPDPDAIEKLQGEIARLEKEVAMLNERIKKLEEQILETPGADELAALRQEVEELRRQLKENNVNVVIDERRKEFRFDSGSPVITPEFSAGLREKVFPELAGEIIKRKERVDTLEIIGHTDGVPLSATGNLDKRLPELLAGELGGSRHLSAGSNNDLGLLRALSLKQEWLDYVNDFEPVNERIILLNVNLRCYSAGQTILPVPEANPKPQAFRRNDPSARRIEMRLTRLGKVEDDKESKNRE